jgi:hypothetical protein
MSTKYTCANCGNVHEEWPAMVFDSPSSYNVLSEDMKQEIGELTSDFCIVRHLGQTDRFIRATLTIEVNDYCQNLEYGIWVSLSQNNYQDYSDNFGNTDHETSYFGWLSNDIPEYGICQVPTTVFTQKDGFRPEVVPHRDFDHRLVRDYYSGISKEEAEKRIEDMLNALSAKERNSAHTKPWWKIW